VAKTGAAGACDIAAARAVVTSRQAGDGDQDRWLERDQAGKRPPVMGLEPSDTIRHLRLRRPVAAAGRLGAPLGLAEGIPGF